MEIIEVFLNTFALDYSSKLETIMRQLCTTERIWLRRTSDTLGTLYAIIATYYINSHQWLYKGDKNDKR